jgi:uncharacterized membrane protein YeaQ/YmgE (transglycosylase-associated protein family)
MIGLPLAVPENRINSIIWCAVGAAAGWLAWVMAHAGGRILLIENVLVGVFGAFIGGDFIAAQLNNGVINDKDFSIRSLAIAITAAVVMLLVLRLLRRVVGPLQAGKKKARARS